MRGKVNDSVFDLPSYRITPAYAGKSRLLILWYQKNQDHPRLCGEKYKCWDGGGWYAGSPPPMRGKVYGKLIAGQTYRITPAYAGKSDAVILRQFGIEDHPRLCGEKPSDTHASITLSGSPPPMRGKEHDHVCGDRENRITPAYAGKRPSS